MRISRLTATKSTFDRYLINSEKRPKIMFTRAFTDPHPLSLLVQNLELQLPTFGSDKYLAIIADKAKDCERKCRRALEILSVMKANPFAHGRYANALDVAVPYAASLREG